ncbi:hypothetical protein N2603_40125 [Bradyrhizobium huanghuaihaiense]|uniref:hypothetical protein n=1 Tax=Bradyrhizobium huanghuaihaiense TaxID=990078 RepID=UPI0021AA37C8|nr:hypothetical protein [Bradyrhizobium sp. CB3035]UWU76065.1 hypothetical protein N2603_40125 [Bradyrhizobium sp. CB3035]
MTVDSAARRASAFHHFDSNDRASGISRNQWLNRRHEMIDAECFEPDKHGLIVRDRTMFAS